MAKLYDSRGNTIPVGAGRGGFFIETFHADDQQALVTTAAGVYALYDELAAVYPSYITKNTLTSGSFTNYEYVFKAGNYNHYESHAYKMDDEIAKPKLLITAGIHGHERTTVMAAYVFLKAMCEGAQGLRYLREAVELHVIPVANPNGYNLDQRHNANSVDLNRNFAADWASGSSGYYYPGASAASEAETKVIQSWIDSNTDALALIDFHNSEVVNEVCLIQSIFNAADAVELKEAALYGMNQTITHWKLDRHLPEATTLFFYTGVDTITYGALARYARNKGVPGFVMETSWNINGTGKHSNATIGVSAEALAGIVNSMCGTVA